MMSLLVGAAIGMVAGWITNRGQAMGCLTKMLAGLIGSWVGTRLFGYWGPVFSGYAILPSILGAVIVIALVSFFFSDR